MHILPPVPKPKNHFRISVCLETSSIHRSGYHFSGSGYAASLRCRAHAVALTVVPEGMLEYEPRVVPSFGTIREGGPRPAG